MTVVWNGAIEAESARAQQVPLPPVRMPVGSGWERIRLALRTDVGLTTKEIALASGVSVPYASTTLQRWGKTGAVQSEKAHRRRTWHV